MITSVTGRTSASIIIYQQEVCCEILAYLTMFNVGSENRDVEDCKVGELLINSECDPVLTLNGEKLIGADRATACKVLDLEDNNKDSISKSRGDYGLYVLFYEDKVSSIKQTYDFGKSY